MSFTISLTAILAILAFASLLIPWKYWHQLLQGGASAARKLFFSQGPRHFTIGLVAPHTTSCAISLRDGLQSKLQNSSDSYSLKVYFGQNDRTQIAHNLQEAFELCDIVVTFGQTCASLAYKIKEELSFSKPVLVCGVRDSQIEFLKTHTNKPMWAVVSKTNYDSQVLLMKKIKNVSKLLLLHRAHSYTARKDVSDFVAACAQHTIQVSSHLLVHQTNISSQVAINDATFDAVVLMKNSLTAHGIQELIAYCNRKRVPLFAHNVDIASLGSAVGIGNEELGLGQTAAHSITNHLERKIPLDKELIHTYHERYFIHINEKLISERHLNISPTLSYLMHNAHVTEQPPMNPMGIS